MYSEQQSQVLMTLKDLRDDKLLQMKDSILGAIQNSDQDSKVALTNISLQLSSLAEASRHQKIVCILNSLDFETRRSRESDIAEAEDQTFEWIFRDHHGSTNQPVGFRQWLLTGNDNFWISGKAGSGKSVLMNYIARAQDTQDLLKYWAGSAQLIIARHFFWNAGAPMQKSQLGLLQTLLSEICVQCPDLLPIVCSSRWSRCYDIGVPWTRHEILKAFKKLERQQLLKVKFCFFVDGVDEYEGEDYTHLVEVLKSLSASPSAKICLSSRPWNVFTTAFGATTGRRLLLEDLNGSDIQKYINSKFEENETSMVLKSREQYGSLVKSIVENARGVFLWVKLVVRSLLRGMSNDDCLSDLHERLEHLPSTLTAYYHHMLDNIDEYYRKDTAELLLICLAGLQPFSLLNLWFYEQEKISPDYAVQAETKSMSRAEVASIFHKIQKRINARGQDLLVIEKNETTEFTHLMYVVRFSHGSVKDFLSKKEILEKLTTWASTGFDARVILCNATLAIAKSLLPSKDIFSPSSYDIFSPSSSLVEHYRQVLLPLSLWSKFVKDFFTYANIAEQNESFVKNFVIDEFQRFSCSFLEPHNKKTIRIEIDIGLMPYTDSILSEMGHFDNDGDMSELFFSLAVMANLKHYAKSKLTTKLNLRKRPFKRPVLDRALREIPWLASTPKLDIEMIRLLLMNGANPNEEIFPLNRRLIGKATGYSHSTVWVLFLRHLRNVDTSRNRYEYEVTRLLIEFGASADLLPLQDLVLEGNVSRGSRSTPLIVIREVFPSHDATSLERLLEKYKPTTLRKTYIYLQRVMRLLFHHHAWLKRHYSNNNDLQVIVGLNLQAMVGLTLILSIIGLVLGCFLLNDWPLFTWPTVVLRLIGLLYLTFVYHRFSSLMKSSSLRELLMAYSYTIRKTQ